MSTHQSTTMSTMTFDQTWEAVLGVSVSLIVLCGLWIVVILVKIEANKASTFYSVDVDHNLELQEESADGLEVEPSSSSPSSPSSPSSSSPNKNTQDPSAMITAEKKRYRRVKMSYKLLQVASVGVLILLTYLLLVTSNAPMWLSGVGSVCVFGVFLRFQIGDELRRQRLDRITLMMALFLFIASLLSLSTYAMKTLKQGEMYEGPARIVGYDVQSYNNSKHDPSTRTDLMVQWGRDWACPLSGSKLCQAHIQGAMCQVTPDQNRKHKKQRQRQRQRYLQDHENNNEDENNNEEDNVEEENQELQQENQDLEQQNEELQKEVEEMEAKEEEEEDLADEQVDEAETIEYEEEYVADAEIEEEAEDELEVEEEYVDAMEDVEEEALEEDEEKASNDEEVEEDEEEIVEIEDEKEEINQEYDEAIDETEEYVEDYDEYAVEEEEEAEELEDEQEETVEEYDEKIDSIEHEDGGNGNEESEAEMEQEEEVMEEEEEEQQQEEQEDDWYWDEATYEYDDDFYESEYWDYDWDSVWGEYACQDLFDEDTSGQAYDATTPAGTDDYPYVNIYGSCKTCEAYILDYFAEEAFEQVDEYKTQAIIYFAGAMAGFALSFIWFLKYKVSPTAENEIELLGSDGGVIA